MPYPTAVLFDLDGTLTDPMEGITKSVQLALRRQGIEVTDRRTLCPFIGPPLFESFQKFYGMDDGQAARGGRGLPFLFRRNRHFLRIGYIPAFPPCCGNCAKPGLHRRRYPQARGICPADCRAFRPAPVSRPDRRKRAGRPPYH